MVRLRHRVIANGLQLGVQFIISSKLSFCIDRCFSEYLRPCKITIVVLLLTLGLRTEEATVCVLSIWASSEEILVGADRQQAPYY